MLKKQTLADVGSERAVLSAICRFGNDAFIDVSDIITADTFTINQNQLLYKCLEEVLKETQKIDIASILTKAEQLKITSLVAKEKNDLEFIRSLFNFPIHLENARNHAKRLAKIEFARKAQESHIEAYKKLSEITGGETIDEILAISENSIFDLITEINRGKESGIQRIGDYSKEYIRILKENKCNNIGIPTPYTRFNKAIGGGLRTGVDLVAARPGVGKSTFALNVGLHVSGNLKIPVIYLDTEMDLDSQTSRILSRLTQIDINEIETGKFGDSDRQNESVNQSEELIGKLPFYYKVVAGKPFEEILSIIRRWIVKYVKFDAGGQPNSCLIIYDYFKLMDAKSLAHMTEWQAMGFQIGKLADYTKEYKFSCLAFVQLNREGIDKETSDILSQSDRLLWLCQSCSFIRWKSKEEIVQDGRENGNMKLQTLKTRYGPGIESGNYINLQTTGNTFTIKEINTKFEAEKNKQFNSDEEIRL